MEGRMADVKRKAKPLPEGARLVRLPKLTRAQLRRIEEVRDWERRSELRLMGFRVRD